MKKLLALILMLAMALSMVACGGGSDDAADDGATDAGNAGTNDSGDSGEVEYLDHLIVATYGDQDTLDPAVNVTNDKVLRLLYDTLLDYDMDGNIVAGVAETWSHSDDYLTWTFNLRDDVYFANGKQMTSADVLATMNRLKDGNFRYSTRVEFVDTFEAPDEFTFVVNCARTSAIVEQTFASQPTCILDSEYIDQYGADIGYEVETVNGTGPYIITDWAMEEYMTFEANPHWWGGEVGTPQMTYKVIPEANSRAMAIETGEVHVLERPASDDYSRLAELEGYHGVSQPGYGLQGFQFNCSEYSMCQDTKVRQAISHAIDREAICEALYGVIGETATHGVMVPLVFGYVDLGVVPYDPELSKQLLAEAGYPDGMDIKLMVYAGYNKMVEVAEACKQYLAEVGVNVEIDVVDNATFNAALNGMTPEEMEETYGWDLFVMGFGGNLDPNDNLRRVMYTSEDGTNVNNYGWYSNAEVDQLLDAGRDELDVEKRAEIYARIQEIVYLEDPFAIYMNLRSSLYIVDDRVEGFNINALQCVEWEKIKVRAN